MARLAPEADLLKVALASNRAFEMVPSFFARYDSPVPADVLVLDYLDFEAKLRAKGRDSATFASTVDRLEREWSQLRPGFIKAGGGDVAPEFDEHVKKMKELAAGDDFESAEDEAQHGLDLVDELEQVYQG